MPEPKFQIFHAIIVFCFWLSLALVVVVMPDFNVFAIYKGHVTLTWQCYANVHLVWGHL
jgi:hypothetical protein